MYEYFYQEKAEKEKVGHTKQVNKLKITVQHIVIRNPEDASNLRVYRSMLMGIPLSGFGLELWHNQQQADNSEKNDSNNLTLTPNPTWTWTIALTFKPILTLTSSAWDVVA